MLVLVDFVLGHRSDGLGEVTAVFLSELGKERRRRILVLNDLLEIVSIPLSYLSLALQLAARRLLVEARCSLTVVSVFSSLVVSSLIFSALIVFSRFVEDKALGICFRAMFGVLVL